MADIEVHLVETRTGKIILNQLPFLGVPQFGRLLNKADSIQIGVPVGDAGAPSAERLRAVTSEWRFSIAVCLGGTVLAYGPIVSRTFGHKDSVLTLGAASMWALFERRYALAAAAVFASPMSMDPAQDLVYTNKTLAAIARDMVSDSVGRGAGYELPIDFDPDVSGTNERNYPVYDLATLTHRLQDLTQVDQGPDIDWDPYLTTTSTIRVKMRVGTPTLRQVGLDLVWDDGSSLETVDVDFDGSSMATTVLTKGNATERASEVAYAVDNSLIAAGWPVLETVDSSHISATEFPTLQGYANEWVRYYKTPVQTWKATVLTDVSPVVGTYKPGDYARFNLQSHPWIPPGSYSQRILGWSQGDPGRLNLVLEAQAGGV